ncbi:CHASE2 domain-containing protein [Sulfurimonas sp. HSL-3221]|uniref:CHASE2 domain-containing protein n=1 Tax=Sulfurimonadaceae TaxID=2771471 RepID=UPI001E37E67C|nr:CHASE2 domain-containing protein [Sulfurimonas sp. HSL-3221]UFS63182.1 CHASE2 domain-containing protein [Sulfurimonas sp. HSL-3221]
MRKFYVAVALSTLLFYLAAYPTALLQQSDNFLYDLYKRIATVVAPSQLGEPATMIVEIDDKSLEALGQWPWPRVLTAKLLEQIGTYKPAAIAADVIFPENDRTSPRELVRFYRDYFGLSVQIGGLPEWLYDNDTLLADTISDLPLLLPLYLKNRWDSNDTACFKDTGYRIDAEGVDTLYTGVGLLCNIPALQRQSRSTGFINAREDRDGIFRRMPLVMRLQHKPVAALAVAMLLTSGRFPAEMRLADSPLGLRTTLGDRTFYTDAHTNVLLRFYPPDTYRRISAVDLLQGRVDPADIRGKYVLVGATAVGLHDRYTVAPDEVLPGIFMHATLIENFFNGDLISQPGVFPPVNMVLSFLSALATLILFRRKRYLSIIFFFGAVTLFYSAAAVTALTQSLYIAPGYFLTPLAVSFIIMALAIAVKGYTQRKQFYEQLSHSHQAALDSMALVAETRDMETGAHIIRTKNYVRLLAMAMARQGSYREILSDTYIEQLFHTAPLHDIGKVGIPDHILKKPGRLTPEEFETMKLHTTYGKEMLDNAINSYRDNEMLRVARNIAYGHHEKWNGSGYPQGLSGEAIPLEARLMALADVYDALISRRYYKEPFSFEETEAIIVEGRGSHFDPQIVDVFLALKEEFRRIAERHQ